MQIAVIGGGSWGTALGHHLANKGLAVTMLVRHTGQADHINIHHENKTYLPGLALAPSLRATTIPQEALANATICLLAVPCQQMRTALTDLAPHINEAAIPVCSSKGIEVSNLCTMRTVIEQTLPRQAHRYAIVSGPSFAQEVVLGKPTAVTIACSEQALGETLRDVFSTPRFRAYSSTDVIGVEIGGALKNVMALITGVCDGLQLGDNSRAALITRGLAEISRLGAALGGRPTTFMGLSGLGDLVLTCTGDLSRNRQVGLRLGRGETLDAIIASMKNVAEGVKTTQAACELAAKLQVEMPLATAMYQVLYNNIHPKAMIEELMTRTLRNE